MKDILRFIKKIFGKYETGYEYWIRIDKIKIPNSYKRTRIREKKWRRKLKYWRETGEFESYILLDKNKKLVDGYSTYKIAKMYNLGIVPVIFID